MNFPFTLSLNYCTLQYWNALYYPSYSYFFLQISPKCHFKLNALIISLSFGFWTDFFPESVNYDLILILHRTATYQLYFSPKNYSLDRFEYHFKI